MIIFKLDKSFYEFLDCQLSKYTFEGHLDYVFKSEEVEYFSKKYCDIEDMDLYHSTNL